MRISFMQTLKRFRHDEEGVTLVEYGIALILAIVVGGTALTLLGNEVSGSMNVASGLMAGPADTATVATD
jgi:Flp pilus assembly pilin Flp